MERTCQQPSMPRKKKQPAPAVVCTGCSSLMSCLSLHRRGSPLLSDNDDTNGGGGRGIAGAEEYWKRVQFLEEEVRRLSKWLGQEERTAPAAESILRGGAVDIQEGGVATADSVRNVTAAKAKVEGSVAATECVRNSAESEEGSGGGAEAATGTNKTTAVCTAESILRGGAVDIQEGGVATADSVRNVTAAKAKVEGGVAATECVRNSAESEEGSGGGAEAATGTNKTTVVCTKRRVSVGHGAGGVHGMKKLEDGSYLHEVNRVGRPWERLAVQVSRPVIPEDAKSASEVLDKMAAMKVDDLWKFFMQMMPLKDISGRQNPGETVRRPATLASEGDLAEAVIFKAMDKMEGLVLEGLKIQMTSSSTTRDVTAAAVGRQRLGLVSKNSRVHLVLMQVRDPKERFTAIGDTMVGLIEVSLEEKDGKVKLEMQEMHLAGISFVNRKSSDGRCMLWSTSLRQCKGLLHHGRGDGCRCNYLRNPNRVFRH